MAITRLFHRFLISAAAALLAACSGGGGGSSSAGGQPGGTPGDISASQSLTLTARSPKIFHFSWKADTNATEYLLLEDPDGKSGFTTIATYSANTTSADIEVSLPKRINAQYLVRACNGTTCTDSTVATISGNLVQAIGYFKASNSSTGANFGTSVALSADGTTLAVGAEDEVYNATGVNGTSSGFAVSSGAVYVFTKSSTGWSQQAYIKASNTRIEALFGSSVSLSGDGNILSVGSRGESSTGAGINGTGTVGYLNNGQNSGAVYVFTRSGTDWSQQAYIKADYPHDWDGFGGRTSLSADGTTLAVTCGDGGRVTGINNTTMDYSSTGSGAVYVYVRSGSTWARQAYIKASNSFDYMGFGDGLAISADGNTLAVGANGEDSSATGINGNQNDYTAEESGAVYVFTRDGTSWSQQAYIKSSNSETRDDFGWSVSLSADGNTLAVGADREGSGATGINGDQADNSANTSGAVYIFGRSGTSWSQEAYIKASNTEFGDNFGWSTALSADGNTLAVGAYREDSNAIGINGRQIDNSIYSAGAAYLFTRTDGAWAQKAYIKPSNFSISNPNDSYYPYFGWSIALSGDGNTLAVSATGEGSNATGINGNQNNATASGSGAVYLY